jgi:hypothetical protein
LISYRPLQRHARTIHQGVVFVDESGEQGWLNHSGCRAVGLNPGAIEPPLLAQAMAMLRTSADNQAEIAAQGGTIFSQPQAVIRNWNWIFSQPQPKVLSLSSTSTRVRDVLDACGYLTILQRSISRNKHSLRARKNYLRRISNSKGKGSS